MISATNSCSFKGYVPVKIYAKNPANGKYGRVCKHENIRKCQGTIVRNLNGTAKSQRNQGFIDSYKEADRDYRQYPVVMSFYDVDAKGREPVVYMITGQDVEVAKQLAKPVGIAKGESKDKLGHTKSYEARYASSNYAFNMKRFLANNCRRLRNADGKELTLQVLFDPVYTKKTDKLKGFEFVDARFVEE